MNTATLSNRSAMPSNTLAHFAAMPAATDEEAGAIAPPDLGLTEADVERLQALSAAWSTAKAAAVAAEQRLTAAQRDADRLPGLRQRAGEHAARAYAMNGAGKALAADTVAGIDAAKLAASALPVLLRDRDAAQAAAGEARGALCAATVAALRLALRRASEHWSALALELTRAAAAVDAIVNALPQRSPVTQSMLAGWHVVRHRLNVPALPTTEFQVPADRAAQDMNFIKTLVAVQHPRCTAHATAAAGRLRQQLAEGLGFDPAKLLG